MQRRGDPLGGATLTEGYSRVSSCGFSTTLVSKEAIVFLLLRDKAEKKTLQGFYSVINLRDFLGACCLLSSAY